MLGTIAAFARAMAVTCGIAFALAVQLFSQAGPSSSYPRDKAPLQVIVVRSREEARQILDRLKKGADFKRIAREQSIDPTAEDSGYLGTVDRDLLRSELRDALKGIDPGQLTPVVPLPSGYAILRVMREGENRGASAVDPSRSLALAAGGSIKYVQDVDGLAEAEAALARFPKPPGWNQDPGAVCELRTESLASVTKELKATLNADSGSSKPARATIDTLAAHFALGQLYAYQGDMRLAIEQYLISYDMAQSAVPEAVPQMEEALGIAYLHQSEM
jgi:PPIC-type PPIASE domain